MPINLDIKIEGLDHLRKVSRADVLYVKPFKELMNAIGQWGEIIAARSAPRGRTGQLEKKNSYGISKRDLPLWVAIRNRARRRSAAYPRGYPYGRLLNYSPKHHHQGWFSNPLKQLGGKVGGFLNECARSIEKNWGGSI